MLYEFIYTGSVEEQLWSENHSRLNFQSGDIESVLELLYLANMYEIISLESVVTNIIKAILHYLVGLPQDLGIGIGTKKFLGFFEYWYSFVQISKNITYNL